jgi:hypothetical protein
VLGQPLTGRNLIAEICSVLYGGNLKDNKERLRTALYDHLRSMRMKPISRQAIKHWLDDEGAQVTRPQAIAFLHDFLSHAVVEKQLPAAAIDTYRQLVMYTARFANIDYGSNRIADAHIEEIKNNNGIVRIISNILAIDRFSLRDERNDLFYPSSENLPNDQSYYLVYRHSTTERAVLKTFLVCKSPQRNFINAHSFVQFIRGGKDFHPDVVKESQGLILKLEKAYYWIGYNYRVRLEDDHPGYQFARIEAKRRPISLELMVTEFDDIGLDRGLFPGLIATTAAMNQPVVGRAAMLHLGTSQSLGKFISHDLVQPSEIRPEELEGDLQETVGRMRNNGCLRFGRSLDHSLRGGNWTSVGAAQLAKRILQMIDNTPAAEATGEAAVHARGAIETFGDVPGSRPRP